MKAVWNDHVIAEAPKSALIYIEGNWYFPPSAVRHQFLRKSDTPYVCSWKGVCQYFDVGEGTQWDADSAWSYPNLVPGATAKVKKDFSNYVAFWRTVQVTD